MVFCRISERPIRIRSRVSEPDYVVVQDATILGELDVTEGIKDDGLILVNTNKSVDELGVKGPYRIIVFPAEGMALRILGRPIVNTALLGAFAALTKELSLDATLDAVGRKFTGDLEEKNAQVVRESFLQLIKELS